MHTLYDLGIRLYGAAIRLSALLGNRKARAWVTGRREWKIRLKQAIDARPGKWIWMHCASLGEFEQGRPLLEAIRKRHPGLRILLTFFSPSGYTIRKDYPGADHVDYLPLDLPANTHAFLDIVRPSAVFFVKYEFWLNYLSALADTRVPTFMVSGIFRPGQIFFRWYGGQFRRALHGFEALFLQDRDSFDLLAATGYPEQKLLVSGDTRLDRVWDIASGTNGDPLISQWCGSDRLIVAGSTWADDERVLLPSIADNLLPDIRLLIAPHEVHEEAVLECMDRLTSTFGQETVVRYSRLQETPDMGRRKVLLLDTMGYLASAYRSSIIAFVGGGFGKGIHNTLEAAVWGVPVIFGPNYQRFREARELIAARAAFPVRSANELSDIIRQFLLDEAARSSAGLHAADYVREHRGATERMLFQLESSGEHPLFS